MVGVVAIIGVVLASSGSVAEASLNAAMDIAFQTNGTVHTIVRSGGVVYIGGSFTAVRPAGSPLGTTETPRANLAAFDAHTGQLLAWDPSADATVRTLAVGPGGGAVYVGGDFATVGGLPRAHLAAVATIGTANPGTVLGWAPRADARVYALATEGTRVYVGGAFMTINGATRKRLAAVNLSTGSLVSWAAGADQEVHALLVSPSGKRVFVGGSFSRIGLTASNHLAALDAITGALTPWASHPAYPVLGLAETSSYLFVAGTGGGGHLPSYLLSTGALRWTQVADGDVTSVSIYHGEVLAGGHFNIVGVQTRHHAALLNATTGLVDPAWAPAFNQILGVFSVLGYGQQAYVGGDFTTVKAPASPAVDQQAFSQFSDSITDTTPPTITTPPDAHIQTGSIVGPDVPVTVSWLGSDDISGICRYTLQQQVNGGAYATIIPPLPTVPTVTRVLIPGTRTYRYQAGAVDCSDNTSSLVQGPSIRVTSFQNTNPAIRYAGTWTRATAPGSYGGTVTLTSQRGATASLTFAGRQIAWIASKTSTRGSANVYVDGRYSATVNLHATTTQRRLVAYTHTFPTDATHTIKIVCLATTGRPTTDIDALLTLR